MRRFVLAVMMALFAMVSLSCDEGAAQQKSGPVGKYVGTIPAVHYGTGIDVFEHEGNLVYYSYNGLSVVPKQNSGK